MMTSTAKTVFEKYEIRKTKAQKTAFIGYVESFAKELGYSCHTEKGWFGAVNIVVGDPEKAKVVYTAHYDTCPVLPFPNFITPRHIWIYLLYQIFVVTAIMLLPMAAVITAVISAGSLWFPESDLMPLFALLAGYAVLLGVMFLVLAGPANKHTANDNTSGVTVLLETMQIMPEEQKNDAAYIFFDLEEQGLFGSGGYASKHKKDMKNKLLVNFDCVSDGNTMLLVLRKGAVSRKEILEKAFPAAAGIQVDIAEKGVFYPSDQANFLCGVGVAALKRTKRGGILYMDRIHTRHDTVYQEENIAYLAESAVRLTTLLHT